MRVLHVVHSMQHGGGIEAFLLNFFRAVEKTNLQLEVCYTGPEAGSLAPELEQLGVKVWGCLQQYDILRFARRFRKELAARGPYDAVHGHVGNFSGPALNVARKLGVPVRLAHYHNMMPGHKNDWPRRLYEKMIRRMVLKSATGIIGLSWAALKYWYPESWDRDPRVFVVRYGIHTKAFLETHAREEVRREFNIPPDAPLIGHVGRFVWQKNHERLIKAMRLVVDQRPEARLLFVGDGVLREAVETQVKQGGLQPNVLFAGLRKDIPRLMSALDVLTLPSLTEGFGLVIIEAQTAGVPIVMSSIPAAQEAVAPAFHEYFRAPEDVLGLADALLKLLERVRREPALREQARAFGSQFSIEASCRAMLAAWKFPGAVAPPDPSGWAGPQQKQ